MKLVTVSLVAAGVALTDCYGCSAGVSNHALLSSWEFVPAELERELNGAFVRVPVKLPVATAAACACLYSGYRAAIGTKS